jgi:hypothetical protein
VFRKSSFLENTMPTLDFPIRVPADVLMSLGDYTGHSWSDSLALEPFICEAIRRYVQAAPTSVPQTITPVCAGYQWKEVFLPKEQDCARISQAEVISH